MSNRSGIEGFFEIKKPNFRIIYGEHFKDVKRRHPEIISDIQSAVSVLEREEEISRHDYGNCEVKLVTKKEDRAFFKVTLKNTDGSEEKYFLKQNNLDRESGVDELKNLIEARDLLKENNIGGVEVVDFVVGLDKTNCENPKSYFVSIYNDHLEVNLDRYLLELYKHLSSDESSSDNGRQSWRDVIESINSKVDSIKRCLEGTFYDVETSNFAYDQETGTIIIFDLRKKEDGLEDINDEEL